MNPQKRIIVAITLLLIIPVLCPHSPTSQVLNNNFDSIENDEVHENSGSELQRFKPDTYSFQTAQTTPDMDEVSGIIDSTIVEQVGYQDLGDFIGRTDTGSNTIQDFSIDEANGWQASTAEVNVWNLNRLYVENGTFNEGYPGLNVNPNGSVSYHPLGWDANSNDTVYYDEDVQLAGYDSSGEGYIYVESQGAKHHGSPNIYGHDNGTYAVWTQVIQNTPYIENFILNFDYFYLRGPIDGPTGNHTIKGNCSIAVLINGINIWNMSLLLVSQRGVWSNTGNIPITISGLPSAFTFEIGLFIDERLILNVDEDYDGDPLHVGDGIVNAYYITAYLDNILLTGVASPEFDQLDFQMNIGDFSTLIEGSLGTGYSNITNPNYWITGPLSLILSANVSIIFEYNARLLSHRFQNSSWTNDVLKQGVLYSISSGNSAELDMFTYLGFLGVYDELQLRIYYPIDWQNFTIYNPFLADVTSSCTLDNGCVLIPTSLLDVPGWWQIHCQSPNYANNAYVERFDSDTMEWIQNTEFHSYDSIRLSVSLGHNSNVPLLSGSVNFTWAMPNCTTWYESSTISGLFGTAESSSVTFGPTNTTAGIWGIIYHWTNGSELAYGCAMFALHHQAALEVVYSDNLETVVGQPATVVLRFFDIENGQLLLDDGASVIGSWAAGVVTFEPNIVKNWWQADFDTALVGAGNFDIIITSSAPYFETTPLVVTLKSQFQTSLNAPTGPLQPLIYGRQYSFDYFYTIDYNGTGVDEALVEISGEGAEWATVSNTGNGHYNLSLTPLGSRDYSIILSFSKEGYQNQTHILSFLVNKVPIEVNILTSLSGPEYQQMAITVEVVEADTNNHVSNANVSLSIMTQYGLVHASAEMGETEQGVYSASIIMPPAGEITYDAIIVVQKENCEMIQDFSFALIPTFDANARLFQAIMDYSSMIILFSGVIMSIIAGQKLYSRKKRRKHTLAWDIKARFTDANNLLGMVVLHKLSGIPVYSKMLKGGFEEGVLSAFITAIMHFRTEFETKEKCDEYAIIPISEVIRSVQTENLICAFITLTPPSVEQELRMKNYARVIGMKLDDTFIEVHTAVIDVKLTETFELMFDDFMDGNLLRRYRIGEKKFPKPLRFIEKAIPLEEKDGSFSLVPLIRLLISYGHSEDDIYIRMVEAIEEEYILPIYPQDNNSPVESD